MDLYFILGKSPDFWRPLMGFMDRQGRVVIEPQFLQVPSVLGEHFSTAGYTIVQRPQDRRYLTINTHGESVFELPADHRPVIGTAPDEHGIFGVVHQVNASNKELWRTDGRDLVFTGETRYAAMRLDGSISFDGYVTQARGGYYVTAEGTGATAKKGLRTHTGETVLPPIYDAITLSRTSPYATTLRGTETNVVTLDGSAVFPKGIAIKGLTDLREVVDGLWVVPNRVKRRADVYDVQSATRIGSLPLTHWPKIYRDACPTLCGGVACINDPTKGSTYYWPNGKPVMPGLLGRPRWFAPEMRTGYFYEGRASFRLGDEWGYMDMDGKHVIPPQFLSDLPFRTGLARVKYPADGNRWDRFSYVDRTGAVIWDQPAA